MTARTVTFDLAKDFISFINKTPSPYHVIEECKNKLVAAGYKELKETDHWSVGANDKCFITRNHSTIIAFAIGGLFKPGNGFTAIGAHTDSPCLKVKPISNRVKLGYSQVGVECYGGGTWHTWFDRDIKLAGRVMIKTADGLEHRLLHINKPILRIPNVAIHLSREMGQKFEFNKEAHFSAVLGTKVAETLGFVSDSAGSPIDSDNKNEDRHPPILLKMMASELNVNVAEIKDFDLCLADCNDAVLGGAMEEFIFAPRLDNLLSSYCALEGLIKEDESLSSDSNIRLICLFDNEEVGSDSAQGAGSSIVELVLRRLSSNSENRTAYEESIPKSLLLSCDVAHAIHPNYSDKHEEKHQPAFHKGMVIKHNANQRYATTSITSALLREVADLAEVPLQDFVIKQDMACGSTIGPIMSAKLAIPVVDIGAPILSMHSIREMGDVSSVDQSVCLFRSFFKNYPTIFHSAKF